MTQIMSLITWLQANYVQMLQVTMGLVLALEAVVRILFPTSSTEGFLQRLGGWIQDAMDFLKVPVTMQSSNGPTIVSPTTAQTIAASNASPTTPAAQ